MVKKKMGYLIQENATNGQLSITVPSGMAAFKGWKKGTKLDFKESMGQIFLIEVHGDKGGYAIQKRNNGNLSITISVQVAKFKKWKGGTELDFKESMGNIYLVEI